MAQKIYTKTGDDGTTSLIGGTKVSKGDTRIEAYGTVDELNAYIGVLIDHSVNTESTSILKNVQDRLFTIGSALACDPAKETKLWLPDLHEGDITELENAIDEMNEKLPEMKHFILPGGHVAISAAHVARTVCRRAERASVKILLEGNKSQMLILKYLNRLSDYLFVLSRFYGLLLDVKEIQWVPRK
ncbi:cob(I)yrinic acid a,c-diamide adenosyltransferase [soil metagenome]